MYPDESRCRKMITPLGHFCLQLPDSEHRLSNHSTSNFVLWLSVLLGRYGKNKTKHWCKEWKHPYLLKYFYFRCNKRENVAEKQCSHWFFRVHRQLHGWVNSRWKSLLCGIGNTNNSSLLARFLRKPMDSTLGEWARPPTPTRSSM